MKPPTRGTTPTVETVTLLGPTPRPVGRGSVITRIAATTDWKFASGSPMPWRARRRRSKSARSLGPCDGYGVRRTLGMPLPFREDGTHP